MKLLVKLLYLRIFDQRILKFNQFFLAALIFISPINAYSKNIIIPNFWNENERLIKPVAKKLDNIRFITTTDFPPFSFIGGEKQISGFHVDLARAICSELGKLNFCQIQALPWDEHDNAMKENIDTVLISGLSVNSSSRQKYRFTRSYFALPARFVGRKTNKIREPMYHSLSGKIIGFISGTAHEAFLVSNFGKSTLRAFLDQKSALNALVKKDIEVVFSDALQMSFWIHSQQSKNCCEFVGGPYLSPRYFGNGLAIAVNNENKELLAALNFALQSISDKGVFSELYLRYFPESLF